MNKRFLIFLFLFVNSLYGFAQLYNDGGIISMESTAIVTVEGALSNVNSGQITAGGNIYVQGDWTNSANSVFTSNNSIVHLNGAAQAVTSGGDAFNGLIAKGTGDKTLNDNTTVSSNLTLTGVKINTQTFILTIAAGGTVVRSTPASLTTEYVIGSLRKTHSATQKNQTYEVGIVSGTVPMYSPVDLEFTSVSSAGVFTVGALPGPHAAYASSIINPLKRTTMQWSIVNGGVIYSGSLVKLHHNGFITGGNPTDFIIQQYFSSQWTSPYLNAVDNTSIQSTGHSYFGDFIAGEEADGIPPPPPPCEYCIPSFAPLPGKNYVLSAWVKESSGDLLTTFNGPAIKLYFSGGLGYTIKASGKIIDGWQRIEQVFAIPSGAGDIKVELVNTSSDKEVFFDDIRIHPFDANMKSFVYDPITLRLSAELDNNNYATFYEYDEEGALVRVKKETERGVMTIKESKNNTIKK